MARNLCAVKECKNSKNKNPELSFHRFPLDKMLSTEWILRLGLNDLADLTLKQLHNKRVCCEHFDESSFVNENSGIKKLKYTALPKFSSGSTECVESDNKDLMRLDLPDLVPTSAPLLNLYVDSHTISCKEHVGIVDKLIEQNAQLRAENAEIKSTMKKQSRQLKKLQDRLVKAREGEQWIKDFESLDQSVRDFFNMQIVHTKKCQWIQSEKHFAISLFQKSPKAYCHLRDDVHFALPCVTLIRKWVNNELPFQPDNKLNLQRDSELNLQPDIELNLQPDTELNLQPDIELNLQPKIESNLQDDIELNLQPKIELDLQPKIELDLQPDIELNLQPDMCGNLELKYEP